MAYTGVVKVFLCKQLEQCRMEMKTEMSKLRGRCPQKRVKITIKTYIYHKAMTIYPYYCY